MILSTGNEGEMVVKFKKSEAMEMEMGMRRRYSKSEGLRLGIKVSRDVNRICDGNQRFYSWQGTGVLDWTGTGTVRYSKVLQKSTTRSLRPVV